MNSDIPTFTEAETKLRDFLSSQGHPTRLVWIFREDILRPSLEKCIIRQPLPFENLALLEKMYDFGRSKGVVGLQAICKVDAQTVAATVQSPLWYGEEPQGWWGFKLVIAQPFHSAQIARGVNWWFLQRLSHYWRFHQNWRDFLPTRSAVTPYS